MVRLGLILCVWAMICLPTYAQLNENFSDGDFTANPIWTPNLASDWTIDNGQLRSNAATANYNFYISTPQTLANTAQWEMKVNLTFNTSGTNYIDVYLISQEANLQSTSNSGYFVRIGGTPDEVSLYKLTSGASAILINGTDGRTNTSNNTLKIKIIRDANNLWNLQTDITGTGNSYQTEGTVTDNSFSTSAFFGFRVQQSTASFFNRHFFDDIMVGEFVPDTTLPTLVAAEVTSPNQILLTFSEAIDRTSAENTANYTANNGIGLPASALLLTGSNTRVTLTYSQNFVANTSNTLLIKDITDLSGNKLLPTQIEFSYVPNFAPQYHELVITEIMTDPRGSSQPTAPLPDAEYIEIYNKTDKVINLKNCKIADEGGEKIISNTNLLLYPKKYLLLCDAGQASNFTTFGQVIGIPSFLALTNAGERLTIKDDQNNLIFTVRYSDSWYGSTAKADGGWSLEMRDVNNLCLEKGNWIASTASRGGTPAQVNSVATTLNDLTAPILLRGEALDAHTVRLTFNEKMDINSFQLSSFVINKDINVQSFVVEAPTYSRVTLTVSPALLPATTYTLAVPNAKDCSGNIFTHGVQFALPTTETKGDIILNEILFNPRTGGVDFVELYNNSEKYINLKDWKLANVQDGITANQKNISSEVLVISPKSYLLLTTNADNILSHYPKSEIRNFFEINDIPSYNDDEGTVILLNANGTEQERFDYKDDFHFALLDDEDGVSLERISPTLPTNTKNSWHSASERVGFATPGYLNSQSQTQAPQDQEIQVNPPIFTPDGDGQDDFTNIQYKFSQVGKVMTAIVYDRQGRKIKTLAENQLLGTEEGAIVWDGTTQTQGLAPQGYYVVVVRVFDTQGNEKLYKKPVALGIRF
jgi:hypothetical protein